jgi:signal transduction histidine kinase
VAWMDVPLQGDSRPFRDGYAHAVSAVMAVGSFTVRASATGRWRTLGADALLALCCFLAWLALLTRQQSADPLDIVLLVLASAPLAVWRLAPVLVYGVTGMAAICLAGRGEVVWPPIGPCLALYLLAASRDAKSPWTWRTTAVVVGLLALYLGVVMAGSRWVATDLGHAVLAGAVAWFAGERTRLRRQQLVDLHERMRQGEESAERELRLAVAEERTQIARDLHDSVGHALTLIAVRAGAARLRQDHAASLGALTDIETLARETTADIEQIVNPLRGATNVDRSPVGLASASALVAQFRAAGHDVVLTQAGEIAGLSVSADQGAYRILQESLTNAARYGSGSTTVAISTSPDVVLITVENPIAEPRPHAGGRHGIVGMRERASLLDGSLTATEYNGQFRVELRLPRRGTQE